jgi:hypothetical protein
VPLIHLRSGKRIAVFAELEGAAIAADLIYLHCQQQMTKRQQPAQSLGSSI